MRATMVRLATGQQMAPFLQNKGVMLTKLKKAQIRDGTQGAKLNALTSAIGTRVEMPATAEKIWRAVQASRPAQAAA